MSVKKLLQRYSKTIPAMTDADCDLLVKEADENQLYVAAMTSTHTQAQHERLKARWTEFRKQRGV